LFLLCLDLVVEYVARWASSVSLAAPNAPQTVFERPKTAEKVFFYLASVRVGQDRFVSAFPALTNLKLSS
jgi:hypothetical protein